MKEELRDERRVEFTPHFHERARRRNIDWEGVKREVKRYRFVDVRENTRSDTGFQYSYKVTVRPSDESYELPIYFNVPGSRILVKIVWPR